jgi:hypothetical protein
MDDKPDIVIAGFPKAGTTALATLLAGHSQISLVEPKEPHRYSWGLEPGLPAANRANALAETAYRDAIRTARSRGRLVIDASTSYSHPAVIAGTVERLADDCPNLRVILAVRDPLKRLVSDWRMRVAEGWAAPRLSIEVRRNLDALKLSAGAADDSQLPNLLAASRDWLGRDRPPGRGSITVVASGFYDPLIAVYRERFGDRLLVVPQESLRSQPETVLTRCFTHLGVSSEPVFGASDDFNLGDYRVETRLSRLMRGAGLAWIARHVLPRAAIARVKRAVTQAPEPAIDDLAGRPESTVLATLYDRLGAETRARMERDFGVRWGGRGGTL